EAREATAAIGRPLEVVSAGTNREIESAFASLAQKRIEALLVSPANLFSDRRTQLTTFSARYMIPTIFPDRSFGEAGGLMSYGPDSLENSRQTGIYTGRILKGEKPGDIPVTQPTKFELVINLQTARLIGVDIPAALLAQANEAIE